MREQTRRILTTSSENLVEAHNLTIVITAIRSTLRPRAGDDENVEHVEAETSRAA